MTLGTRTKNIRRQILRDVKYHPNNIAQHMSYSFAIGDVENGFQEADYIIEGTFRTSKQKHCQLELDATVAQFDASGRLTIWSQCQAPHPARRRIAEMYLVMCKLS